MHEYKIPLRYASASVCVCVRLCVCMRVFETIKQIQKR